MLTGMIRRVTLLAAVLAAVSLLGCISMEDRISHTEEGGTFSEGLQAVLMISNTEVKRGRPIILHFAIKNGDVKEARITKSLSRDSGWAGLVIIGPDGAKPPYQDIVVKKAHIRKKETVLLRTGEVHVVQWMLTGEETRALEPGYHSLRGIYMGVENPNRICDNWWQGVLESNPKFIRVR